MKSSFREALARPAAIPAASRSSSGIPVRLRLRPAGSIPRPVALARELTACGLSLGRAHAVLERLVVGKTVVLDLTGRDQAEMIDRLSRLGVGAEPYVLAPA